MTMHRPMFPPLLSPSMATLARLTRRCRRAGMPVTAYDLGPHRSATFLTASRILTVFVNGAVEQKIGIGPHRDQDPQWRAFFARAHAVQLRLAADLRCADRTAARQHIELARAIRTGRPVAERSREAA